MSLLQDNAGVRTVQDILRAYDLSLLGKNKIALEQQKLGLNKLENEKEEILKSLILNLGSVLESQSDISLWFFDGIPTLENNPAINWGTTTLKNQHIGDFYYNKQNGRVYKFLLVNDTYSWSRVDDNSLSQAMALTNASLIDGDNERKVFWTTPIPEYECGDWWLKDNLDLYICQISKDSTQEYEEEDFIIATKYTDDTLARKTDNELTIVSGSVAVLRADTDNITTTVSETITQLNTTNENIQNLQESISTQFQQTNDAFNFKFINEILPLIQSGDLENQEKLATIEKFIRFEAGDIILGATDSNFSVKITNEKILFLQGTNKIAYFSNNELYINKAIIAKSLTVGESTTALWEWTVDSSGNLNLGRAN